MLKQDNLFGRRNIASLKGDICYQRIWKWAVDYNPAKFMMNLMNEVN
jgi:hypothetical protein